MNWNISDLKARGKEAFLRNYWKCVLVAFILSLVTASGGNNNSSRTKNVSDNINKYTSGGYEWTNPESFGDFITDSAAAIGIGIALSVIAIVVVIVVIISILLNIFVFHPLEVGCRRFFINNASGVAAPSDMGYVFRSGNYGTVVVTLFLRNLYIALWTILLVIPGIIKAYEYRMVAYLLADDPTMTREEAFRLSKQMMDGQKWNAFVLDLSFIGWNLLAAITFGILGAFYVNPYIQATDAELYLTLRSYQSSAYSTY